MVQADSYLDLTVIYMYRALTELLKKLVAENLGL
jgi:hypothetical protein